MNTFRSYWYQDPIFWDNWFRERKYVIVSGLAIVNEYISMDDAVLITFSYN